MKEPFARHDVKVAVIGGGTGSFTMLTALKRHTKQIAAIVSMADDGGSTGVLRDELGALPPGDVRQCLVALSDSPKVRDMFQYRFDSGTFGGHSLGNVLLSGLERMTGDFTEAVETAGEILGIKGAVIPATLDDVRLKMSWGSNGDGESIELHGERVIDTENFRRDPRQATLSLIPQAAVNPMAIRAIEQADVVVIAPGDVYTSLGPLLIIDGIGEALRNTKAKKIYVSNLVSKQGQTDGFTVSDHASEIERLAGGEFLDYVVYNDAVPSDDVIERYDAEGGKLSQPDVEALDKAHYTAVSGNFLGAVAKANEADSLIAKRSLIRHDTSSIARVIMGIAAK